MMTPRPVIDPVDLAREIIAGQTGRLTRYVRALDYASALLATTGPFETPEQARDWALHAAERRARDDDE
jgi:hypothetical protein